MSSPRRSGARPETILARGRTALLISGVVLCWAAWIIFRLLPAVHAGPGGLNWLALSGLLCGLAVVTRGERVSEFFGLAAAASGITSIYGGPIVANPGVIVAASSVIVLWAGLVLSVPGGVLVSAYAFAAPWFYGAPMRVLSPAGPHELHATLHLVAVGLPIFLAVVVRRQQLTYANALLARFESLARRETELTNRLNLKAEELELSQQKLLQAQKLETVGTMASGLAHELNNLLTPIRGMAELVAENSEDDAIRHHGRRILDAAESAAAITGALLTYARKGSFSPVRTNLRHLVERQIMPVLSQSIPEAIDVELELDESVDCDVDRVLFQQCLTNLIFNAIDAMPGGGELSIRLSRSEAKGGTDEPGYAVLEIRDSGEGMSPAVRKQIFDPFFTTKAVGTGTGLGLAMVHGGVVRHGGEIEVASSLGRGSCFTLRFPLARRQVPSRPWPVLGGRRDRPIVVVVTDDVDVRDELEEMLSDLECTPICSNEPGTIRTMLAEVGERVNLLLVEVPADDPREAVRFIHDARGLSPDLPIAVLSDGPRDPSLARILGPGPLRVARAPMDAQMLAALLSDLLRPEGYSLPYWALPSSASSARMPVEVFSPKQEDVPDSEG